MIGIRITQFLVIAGEFVVIKCWSNHEKIAKILIMVDWDDASQAIVWCFGDCVFSKEIMFFLIKIEKSILSLLSLTSGQPINSNSLILGVIDLDRK